MTGILLYSLVAACLVTIFPTVYIAMARRRHDRAMQKRLEEYVRQTELRLKFDAIRREQGNCTNVINVDFVDHTPEEDDIMGWKLVYNKDLGVYQKVRR